MRCPFLALPNNGSNVRVNITGRSVIDSDSVKWFPLKIVGQRTLPAVGRFLQGFKDLYSLDPGVSKLLSHSGKVHDKLEIHLTVLRFEHQKHAKRFHVMASKSWNPVQHFDNVKGKPIQILSAPFSLVNPAIFAEYRSSGTLSYIATRNGKVIAMLSDIRFLDGMETGVVEVAKRIEVPTLGLVGGSLRRKSGEGSLTVIVPWWEVLDKFTEIVQLNPSQCPSPGASTHNDDDDIVNGPVHKTQVLALTVSRPGNLTVWGSAVVIDGSTVVTNLHVIGDRQLSIKGWISHVDYVNLKILGAPIQGLDLVFLEIYGTATNISADMLPLTPATIQPILPHRGGYVTSIGYGLFYPNFVDSPLSPLVCGGIISSIVEMKLENDYLLNSPMPVMIVATSGCWNGSSGGALVNQQGELIGIMASNGRIDDSGNILPEMAFIIPSPLLILARKLLKEGQTVQLPGRVRRLWQLRETHLNVEREMRARL